MALRHVTTQCLDLYERILPVRAAATRLANAPSEDSYASMHASVTVAACSLLLRSCTALVDSTLLHAKVQLAFEAGEDSLTVSESAAAELARLTEEGDRLLAWYASVGSPVEKPAVEPPATPPCAPASESPQQPPTPRPIEVAAPRPVNVIPPEAAAAFEDRAALFTESQTGLRGAGGGVPPGHTVYSWTQPMPLAYSLRMAQEAVAAGLQQRLGLVHPTHDSRLWLTYDSFSRLVAEPLISSALEKLAPREGSRSGPPSPVRDHETAAGGAAASHSGGGRAGLFILASPASPRVPELSVTQQQKQQQQARAGGGVTVLGAGAGLLQLYLSLSRGVSSRGFSSASAELEVARAAAAASGIDSSSVVFIDASDIAGAPSADGSLSRSSLVFVDPTRSFDAATRRAVYSRLLTQLPQGAIVVDTQPMPPVALRPMTMPFIEARTPRGVFAGSSCSSPAPMEIGGMALLMEGTATSGYPMGSPTATAAAAAAAAPPPTPPPPPPQSSSFASSLARSMDDAQQALDFAAAAAPSSDAADASTAAVSAPAEVEAAAEAATLVIGEAAATATHAPQLPPPTVSLPTDTSLTSRSTHSFASPRTVSSSSATARAAASAGGAPTTAGDYSTRASRISGDWAASPPPSSASGAAAAASASARPPLFGASGAQLALLSPRRLTDAIVSLQSPPVIIRKTEVREFAPLPSTLTASQSTQQQYFLSRLELRVEMQRRNSDSADSAAAEW